MAYEMKDNSGTLFKNEEKQKENQPDYTGKAQVNGKFMFMSAWVKEAKSGKKYMSFAFTEPQEKKPTQQSNSQQYTDDIPF